MQAGGEAVGVLLTLAVVKKSLYTSMKSQGSLILCLILFSIPKLSSAMPFFEFFYEWNKVFTTTLGLEIKMIMKVPFFSLFFVLQYNSVLVFSFNITVFTDHIAVISALNANTAGGYVLNR